MTKTPTRRAANKAVAEASRLVQQNHLRSTSGPYRNAVRASLALMRNDYQQAVDLAQGVIGFLTPPEARS